MSTIRIRSALLITTIIALLALFVVLFIVPAASARGNAGAPLKAGATNHIIAVGGHGEVNVPPDEATMTLGVESRASTAQAALSDNSSKMSAVISAVESQGVPANHIQTSDLSIWYDSEHNTYTASHQITVRIDNVDKVGQVLDAAVAAGATNSWGVSFGLKDPSAAHAQALQKAVTDARTRANGVATALGVSISGVGSAEEPTYQTTPVRYGVAAGAPAPAGSPPPVQPGQLTVTADINVVYTFG